MKEDAKELKPLNIVFVNNTEEVSASLLHTIEQAGFRVRVCPSKRFSFGSLGDFDPSLVIWAMDAADPNELDTVRLFRKSFAFERFGLLPMVALTWQSQPEILQKIYEEGFQAVLPMPLEARYLLHVLEGMLSLKQQWIATSSWAAHARAVSSHHLPGYL